MSRPHEDRQRHTLVDHRPGGSRVSFGVGSWCAIDIAAVKSSRALAALSAYETLIEKMPAADPARQCSALFRSIDHRRVVAFVELRGHAEFRHLAASWDDHHLYAEHRASAESTNLALFRIMTAAGDARIDPASPDRYLLENVSVPAARVGGLLKAMALALGYRGVILASSDDETSSIIVYRFEHEAEFEAFRTSPPAVAILGAVGATGETLFAMHPVKTFGDST